MLQTTFEMVYDQASVDRILTRFSREITALESVGFQRVCAVREILGPYSIFYLFPHAIMAMNYNDLLQIEPPFRLVLCSPLWVCHETVCLAVVFGRGVRYMSHFDDGTALITNNFVTATIEKPVQNLYKSGFPSSLETAHRYHQEQILKLVRQGKVLDHHLDFEDYKSMSYTELKALT